MEVCFVHKLLFRWLVLLGGGLIALFGAHLIHYDGAGGLATIIPSSVASGPTIVPPASNASPAPDAQPPTPMQFLETVPRTPSPCSTPRRPTTATSPKCYSIHSRSPVASRSRSAPTMISPLNVTRTHNWIPTRRLAVPKVIQLLFVVVASQSIVRNFV